MLYEADGHRGRITYWKDNLGWVWEALGNTGRETTKELAVTAAKYWIKYG